MNKHISKVYAASLVLLAAPALANDGTTDAATSMAGPLAALTDFLNNSGGS